MPCYSTSVLLLLLVAGAAVAAAVSGDMSLSKASEDSPSLPMPELVERLTNETFDRFVADRDHITVVLFYATWHPRSVTLLSMLETVAERFMMESTSVESPTVIPTDALRFAALHGPHYKSFCLQKNIRTFPVLRVVVRGLVNEPYTFTGHTFEPQELYEFLHRIVATDKRQAALDREEKRQLSERIPTVVNPTPGLVLTLDPEEFQRYRNATNVLMFVLFYAPWCQHCKGPQETLKAVADYFQADKSVVIGKLDCDAFSTFCVETMNLEGYPTFMTVSKPSMAKEGSIYRGGHDAVDIHQHLDKQNQFFEAEGMEEIKQQFEKLRKMPRDEIPSDLSELGGVFAQFKQTKKKDDDQKQTLGRKRRTTGGRKPGGVDV